MLMEKQDVFFKSLRVVIWKNVLIVLTFFYFLFILFNVQDLVYNNSIYKDLGISQTVFIFLVYGIVSTVGLATGSNIYLSRSLLNAIIENKKEELIFLRSFNKIVLISSGFYVMGMSLTFLVMVKEFNLTFVLISIGILSCVVILFIDSLISLRNSLIIRQQDI